MSFELSDNFNDDVIDVRDIIERVEDLRGECDSRAQDFIDYHEDKGTNVHWDEGEAKWAEEYPEDARELAILEDFLSDLKGYGGDEQWEGDWYPVTLVNADHFTEYAQELAEEIAEPGMRDAAWPYRHIDWEAAANELQQDYSTVDLKPMEEGGEAATYYYRG
jgi:hypothetical protein